MVKVNISELAHVMATGKVATDMKVEDITAYMSEGMAEYIASRETLADNAQKRMQNVKATFTTANYARFAKAMKLNLAAQMVGCDKTLDRNKRVVGKLMNNDMTLADDKDLNRITFGLLRTAVAAVAAGEAKLRRIERDAAASKVTVEMPEYVAVAQRHIAASTADRQGGIAEYVLAQLGVLTRARIDGHMQVAYVVNSPVLKLVRKIIAAEQGATAQA